jgi:hypothetical protein
MEKADSPKIALRVDKLVHSANRSAGDERKKSVLSAAQNAPDYLTLMYETPDEDRKHLRWRREHIRDLQKPASLTYN